MYTADSEDIQVVEYIYLHWTEMGHTPPLIVYSVQFATRLADIYVTAILLTTDIFPHFLTKTTRQKTYHYITKSKLLFSTFLINVY